MPQVLMLHTVGPDRAVRIRELIEERVPEIDLRVARSPAESRELIPTAEALVTGSFSPDLLDDADELRWVQSVPAGVDGFPLDRLREAGIVLTNSSGVHARPIAENVLTYALLFERNLLLGIDNNYRGVWEKYGGEEIHTKTMGVIGVGAIGGETAKLAADVGMTVVGVKRDPSTAPDALDEVWTPDRLYELLDRADYVTIACPLTDETRGMIGADELRAMGESAVLINIARGEIADETALTEALQKRKIRGAALDVFETEPLPPESPLWELSNVIVTPHNADVSPHKDPRFADIFAENYRAFDSGDDDAFVNRIL